MALATQTLILGNPTFVSPNAFSLVATTGIAFSFFSSRSSRPKTRNYFSPKPNFYKPLNLTLPNVNLSCKNPSKPYMLACSRIDPWPTPLTESTRPALTESTPVVPENYPTHQDLAESTRTISTLVASAILISKLFGHAIANYVQGVCKMPSPNQLLTIQGFQESMISTASPLFFAAIKIHRQQLHTPWGIMASGLAKCIEVYMAILAIRCAMSFFPSIEWNRQPYRGLRDMSDPFLLFFQSIVPPVFDTLDISASVGFFVLSVLVEILSSRAF
ncbi:hypothetical protein POM88_035106 [Heracleum sosnowskyi]|uniref:YGGT family protein n=1 Tax=Heracleum sosnowskyi TaxID=360622 RepID=A0AAD8HMF1_9APIA|nr:hypothetical protein POM88_035106 [Heracleum sosnowskyi]